MRIMKTARKHILELYPELTQEEFTVHLVELLMESYAKEHAIKFAEWYETDETDKLDKFLDMSITKLYEAWINSNKFNEPHS